MFDPEETERFRGDWLEVQGGFVDQPRESVERVDARGAEVTQPSQRGSLNVGPPSNSVGTDTNVSIEDLRVTVTRYRSFFERLISAQQRLQCGFLARPAPADAPLPRWQRGSVVMGELRPECGPACLGPAKLYGKPLFVVSEADAVVDDGEGATAAEVR